MKTLKADVHVRDEIASTTIQQVFRNPNSSRMEGSFLFPVPANAHLEKFTMDIDGKPVSAELLTADRARSIYEDIVRRSRDPALFEYAGRDLYKIRIFPIEPNSDKRITVSYTQLLKSEDGLLCYTLPLAAEKYSACRPLNSTVHLELKSSKPLKSVYSPTHNVRIDRRGSDAASADFESLTGTTPPTDFVLYFARNQKDIGFNLLTHKSPGEDGYFMLLASPGVSADTRQVVPKDIAFVLDTSGSMAGKKLEQAQNALLFCIENLNDQDRFDIVRFSTEVETHFDRLVPASVENRQSARSYVRNLKPIGGTDIEGALKRALKLAPANEGADRIFMIIFLTDGLPTVGTTDEGQIISSVKQEGCGKTRVFCFGIGSDVNTHLLDKVTEATRAFSQYVLPEEDIEVKVSSFYTRIKEPVLANPELKFTGIRTSQLYPPSLPDIFKGDQLVVVGKYTGQGHSAAVLEGAASAGRKQTTANDVEFPAENAENDYIPRLWATRRVGWLLDEIRLHGENSELRDETTVLARKFGIVTPYTAYLIVEDEARREVPMSQRSLQSFDQDALARSQASAAWGEFKNKRVGEASVADAQSSAQLRVAQAPATAASDSQVRFMQRYGLRSLGATVPAGTAPANVPEAATRVVQYAQQSQTISGKTFFQNGEQWIDASIQAAAKPPRVRIQFGSPAYFEFASQNPATGPWLALGRNIQFLLKEQVYEIYP